ncbi:GH07323p [Strongyloides ratti]|uniref:GH07323p n=1 Tax=Strongyloides ratti TaxID=34506 RepID=A0A090L3H3_STRRB|nr:GH07323p [Strongyloides ratti]CEF64242.1 GH07323p [Strongyloides ratti]
MIKYIHEAKCPSQASLAQSAARQSHNLKVVMILACVAPAIIVPVMIKLKNENVYESKGVISIILTSVTLINMFCTTSFTMLVSVCFENMSSYLEIPKPIFIGIFFGTISGIVSSLIMVYVFKNEKKNSPFKKAMTIMAYCLLMFFGSKYYKNDIIGSVGIIVFTLIINYNFNKNNEQGLKKEDNIFKYGWNNFIEPVLFSTIGTTVQIKEMNINIILIALLITIISTIVKCIAVILIQKLTHLNYKEMIYIGFSFSSKATVQATLTSKLALLIVQKNLSMEVSSIYPIDKTIIVITIISIIISAPLGHALLTFFPHFIIRKEIESSEILDGNSETEEKSTFI